MIIYVPEKVVTNDDLSTIVETNDEWIASRTGIRRRHLSTGENTSEFCIEVGKKLLSKTNTNPEDIDLIIVATITSDYSTPSTACLVQGALGCENAWAFDLSAACSGFVYALSVADKFVKSGQYKKVLVFGAETLSKIVDWTDRATCVLFGDGAGGALVEPSVRTVGSLMKICTVRVKMVLNLLVAKEKSEIWFTIQKKKIKIILKWTEELYLTLQLRLFQRVLVFF